MTTTAAQIRAWTGPAFLTYGFRPFFFGAAVWAALSMVLWVPMLTGHLALPAAFDPVGWHAHEFLFGYLGAVIAGFLLTAVPNWTGRLFDPRIRVNSSFADIAILVALWLQIVVGMGTIVLTLGHMDGTEMVRFMTWSQSVMTLQINAWLEVVNVHWLYKAHIVLGMVIVAAFPFTRLVHMLSIPVRYVTLRPGYQIVRSRRRRPLEERRRAHDKLHGKSGPTITTPAE